VGYGLGTALKAAWDYLQPEERRFRRALAFRQARKDWETKNGRPPNSAEVKEMAKGFDLSVEK